MVNETDILVNETDISFIFVMSAQKNEVLSHVEAGHWFIAMKSKSETPRRFCEVS